MSAAQLERLQEQMQRLRLFKSRERVEALLQDATAKEASYADFLDTLLTAPPTRARPIASPASRAISSPRPASPAFASRRASRGAWPRITS